MTLVNYKIGPVAIARGVRPDRLGEVRPALVVKQWDPTTANIVVFFDGNNDYPPDYPNWSGDGSYPPLWLSSVHQGTDNDQYTT